MEKPSLRAKNAHDAWMSPTNNCGSAATSLGLVETVSVDTTKLPRSVRHCERSEAIHSATCGNMDCFVAFAPRNNERVPPNYRTTAAVWPNRILRSSSVRLTG